MTQEEVPLRPGENVQTFRCEFFPLLWPFRSLARYKEEKYFCCTELWRCAVYESNMCRRSMSASQRTTRARVLMVGDESGAGCVRQG